MPQSHFTIQEMADFLGGELKGDASCLISGLATLDQASEGQLSFFANSRYLEQLKQSRASVVLVSPKDAAAAPGNVIVLDNPYLGYARVSRLFDPRAELKPGVCTTAVVDSRAEVSESAQICANAVIGPDSVIGDNVYVGPGAVIGARCRVDQDVRINANVTVYDDVKVGARSLIHSAAVIGADGFGFANEQGKWVKISQLGGVAIGEDVEIGACTTIDRGALSDTRIGNGVKLDNQIQIGHNVEIGEDTAIAACAAVAGSTKIGARCTIAGASGIAGHIEICDGTHITAMSLISRSIKERGAYSSGTGMMAHSEWRRSVVRFRQLDELAKRVKSLEEQIEISKG